MPGIKNEASAACPLAEGFGMNCEIGIAANLSVIFSVTNCDCFEYRMPQRAHQFGLVEDIKLNDRGVIEAPTLPGLGHELGRDWINGNRIATLE